MDCKIILFSLLSCKVKILLDIDGVMVPAKSWSPPPQLEDGFSIFSSKAVQALNEILSQSGADILLTTSHKHRFSVGQWKKIFEKRGIIIHGLSRLPENKNYLSRLAEIQNWLATRGQAESFVIIDDDKSLNDLPRSIKERLIQTQPMIGLSQAHVSEALRILSSSLELA